METETGSFLKKMTKSIADLPIEMLDAILHQLDYIADAFNFFKVAYQPRGYTKDYLLHTLSATAPAKDTLINFCQLDILEQNMIGSEFGHYNKFLRRIEKGKEYLELCKGESIPANKIWVSFCDKDANLLRGFVHFHVTSEKTEWRDLTTTTMIRKTSLHSQIQAYEKLHKWFEEDYFHVDDERYYLYSPLSAKALRFNCFYEKKCG